MELVWNINYCKFLALSEGDIFSTTDNPKSCWMKINESMETETGVVFNSINLLNGENYFFNDVEIVIERKGKVFFE